jgi:DNA-binding Lrp family transcriptional regulator
MATRQLDEGQLKALHDEGKTHTEISRLLGIPRSTVRERLEKLAQSPPVETEPVVNTNGHTGDMSRLGALHDTLEEMAAWWESRQVALRDAQDGERVTRRVTFFVEKRHEDAIRRQSDIDGLTYTAIVNEALRQYFSK